MEDSLKGFYVTLTVIFIFVLCITNFIVFFPLDQGVNFSASYNNSESSTYLVTQSINSNPDTTLTSINNNTKTGFDAWDITQGFMGSNTLKQSSQGGFTTYVSAMFHNLIIMATALFGINSPVLIVIGILLTATLGYVFYIIVAWVRTGR